MWTSEECEMEKIICKKKVDNKWFYLIKWAGYSSKQNTWEEEKNIYCKEMLEDFEVEWRQKKIKKLNNNQNFHKNKKLRKIRSNDNMGFADLFSKHLSYNKIKEEDQVVLKEVEKVISINSSNDEKKILKVSKEKKRINIFSSVSDKKENMIVEDKKEDTEKEISENESSQRNSSSFIIENSNNESDSILVVENEKKTEKKNNLITLKKENTIIKENKEFKEDEDKKREENKNKSENLEIFKKMKKPNDTDTIKNKDNIDKIIDVSNNKKFNFNIYETETNILCQKEITPKNCFISDYIWIKDELYFLISEKNTKDKNINIGYFSKKYCTKMIPSKLCKFYEKYIIIKKA